MPSTAVNLSIEKAVRNLHDKMGVDIDDPALRLDGFQVGYSVHEDMVPNTFHFLLILVGRMSFLYRNAKILQDLKKQSLFIEADRLSWKS